ncbi:hypothetical protein [Mobilicoccus massiliensis]|uniref:hypothetical protein n=1 Tax=Mobilicoccus massiliensis TaxID=1522310 RepID=UPI00114484F2|nr:hypothetical protein [Mobilicoccus massiliensis]
MVTALGSWLGSRHGPDSRGISQNATTHGSNSRITQTVNQNTWHISPRLPAPKPEAQSSGSTSSAPTNDDDDVAKMIGLCFAVVAGVSALTWAIAAHWGLVLLITRIVTMIALFITALTWWRWPAGVRGAGGMRVAITAIGSAVLWALSALPIPVRHEPSLREIERATSGMSIVESVTATWNALGLDGVFAYEMRLAGVALLLLLLYTTTSRGLGAVIAESAARRTPPWLGLVRLGNWLIGPATMGFGYFAWVAFMAAIAILLVHPGSTGWLIDHFSRAPALMAP